MSVNYTSMPPQVALQAYMQNNGVSEAEAKAQLEAMYGKPNRPPKNQDPNAFLEETGMTKEEAIAKYGNPVAPQDVANTDTTSLFASAGTTVADTVDFTSDDTAIADALTEAQDEIDERKAKDDDFLKYLIYDKGLSDDEISGLSDDEKFVYAGELEAKLNDAVYEYYRHLGYSDSQIKALTPEQIKEAMAALKADGENKPESSTPTVNKEQAKVADDLHNYLTFTVGLTESQINALSENEVNTYKAQLEAKVFDAVHKYLTDVKGYSEDEIKNLSISEIEAAMAALDADGQAKSNPF